MKIEITAAYTTKDNHDTIIIPQGKEIYSKDFEVRSY